MGRSSRALGRHAQSHPLRVRDVVHAMLADDGAQLCLSVGALGSLELSGPAIYFVQRMLAEREFIAGDSAAWTSDGKPFAWSDVQSMLTSLKREGLLQDA